MFNKMLKKFTAAILMVSLFIGNTDKINAVDLIDAVDFDYKNTNKTTIKNSNNEQILFTINNCEASKNFNFRFNLKPGERMVPSNELLGFNTNEILVMNENNEITYIIDAPWAKDAKGQDLSTYYSIKGNILTQTVEHDCQNFFPITADPNAWQITVCAAKIASFLTGVALPISKILKIRKAIKAVGSIRLFASIVIAIIQKKMATDALKKIGGQILMDAVMTIIGLDGIASKCALF